MRLLFVAQRYGESIAGGAEAACRALAERLAARGHDVDVVTSCATSYEDWADVFARGSSELNGVQVHRLPVRAAREPRLFAPLHHRALSRRQVSLAVQRDWLRVHGPELPDLPAFLEERAGRYDVVAFSSYLFAPTATGLPIAAARTATIVHPAAHDEPALELDVFDPELRHADAIACYSMEEMQLIERRLRAPQLLRLIGTGIDDTPPGDGARFRRQFGLGERPYLLYLGRLDPGKGADELYRFARAAMARDNLDVALVVAGENVMGLPPANGVVITGFVDDQTKYDALAGASVFANPSYFESFSIVLCEAWIQGRPALVQGASDVLAGHVGRSGGGLAYRSFAEFDVALRRLLDDAPLRDVMGQRGRNYVLDNFGWPAVIERYEALLVEVRSRFDAARRPNWFVADTRAAIR
ncbi:MAG: glycosyltransferase family 4 protein [Acidimicrobiales bacterium]